MRRTVWACMLAGLIWASPSMAGRLTIQGHLGNGGASVEGPHQAVFTFYDAQTDGNALWTETDTIQVQSCLFTAVLGLKTPIPDGVFSGSGAWLETTVDGAALAPRLGYFPQPVNVGPGQWQSDGPNVFRTSGNVGIGTTTPLHPLEAHTTQPGQVGYFHSLAPEGTNYGIDAGAQGVGATTNIGGYFYASGATNNYAIIVPPGHGNVGIQTDAPEFPLDVHSTDLSRGVRYVFDGSPWNGAYVMLGMNNARGAILLGNSAPYNGAEPADDAALWQTTGGWQWNRQLNIMGNVGIGTAWPSASLDVAGNCNVSGHLTIGGNLNVTGTKCRVVDTGQYGRVKMNAAEAGHALFMDDGSSARLVNGRCHVNLEPKFLATVTVDEAHPLIVNVTFYGPHGEGWYVERDGTGFTVVDPSGSNAEFSWTVTARQKGYADTYLEPVEAQTAQK